ncbi:AMP-binding protein [Thalassotalea psychrophila]|uniref:AMP-binding protein n=2 Tax=Thalassotalea psychrophila TaxID=3065647 RepID=A0ABY9TSP7_9GAMM|nr:AMP-binding protein [Colwelliaceae bacterium SQ149]
MANNVTTIVCYLACLLKDHPVLLLDADNKQQNQKIIDSYQPNIIIHTQSGSPEITVKNKKLIKLHSELAILLTTSGSTGSPKLVKLSKKNITSNTQSICEYLQLTDKDRAITSLKGNYSYGMSVINTHLFIGASLLLTNMNITDHSFFSLFDKFSISNFSGVPYNFELLSKQNLNFANFPSLRFVTQAGGKLSNNLVLQFAKQAKQGNFKFFIMYGQTEASPRISYLPPDKTLTFPDFIGIAIPGGELLLYDDNEHVINQPLVEGELVYQGDNIMLGYASTPDELADDEQITRLKTGDIAFFNEQGLYKIVGRKSRFAKPYGLRVNLDDIEAYLKAEGVISTVTCLSENILVFIVEDRAAADQRTFLNNHLAAEFHLPKATFIINFIIEIPRLGNGKINYQMLNTQSSLICKKLADDTSFWQVFKQEFLRSLKLSHENWSGILEIFVHFFPNQDVSLSSSFISLGGDSLQYITISTEVEQYLASLPNNWSLLSISELESIKAYHGI